MKGIFICVVVGLFMVATTFAQGGAVSSQRGFRIEGDASDLEKADKELRSLESQLLQQLARKDKEENQQGVSTVALVEGSSTGAAPIEKTLKNTTEEKSIESEISEMAEEPRARLKEAAPTEPDRTPELERANAELRRELEKVKAREAKFRRDLDTARSRLLTAEVEVERLSTLLDKKMKNGITRYAPGDSKPASRPVASKTGSGSDLVVATVIVDKAFLRTGPGKDHSPLMTVSRGNRLTVESRRDDWYMVIAPTGNRAWVSGEVLAFGASADASPNSTVRVRGYDRTVEDEAFELIKGKGQ